MSEQKHTNQISRRKFLLTSALTTSGIIASNLCSKSFAQAPGIVTSDKMRPQIPYGVACGDITGNSAVIWSKTDRPARIIVEYSTGETFRNVERIVGSAALETTDFTARVYLSDLPTGQQLFYRVIFQDLADRNISSTPVTGRFRTPANEGKDKDIFFAWSGCSGGQGWGINRDWGGMKIYETIRKLDPDFFIHCGDNVYPDNPIQSEERLENGTIWKNITTAEKSKVAETLTEFRGHYIYNLLDENVRRFNAEVPLLVQWDDHETTNNWYPGEILDDDRYTVKSCDLLAARGKRALLEYMPFRWDGNDPERIYRGFKYGANLDIFMLDERSYRGPNTANRQTVASAETAFLGNAQVSWLKSQLLGSKATWKVIASDMPIGIIVRDREAFENFANGDGPALGQGARERVLERGPRRVAVAAVLHLAAGDVGRGGGERGVERLVGLVGRASGGHHDGAGGQRRRVVGGHGGVTHAATLGG